MKFIRIGNRIINMDMVTDIERGEDGSADIFLAAPQQHPVEGQTELGTRMIVLSGDEAEDFWKWLEQQDEFDDLNQKYQEPPPETLVKGVIVH